MIISITMIIVYYIFVFILSLFLCPSLSVCQHICTSAFLVKHVAPSCGKVVLDCLTLDIQGDGVALAVPDLVATDAGVQAPPLSDPNTGLGKKIFSIWTVCPCF